jgi:hypothetical protein
MASHMRNKYKRVTKVVAGDRILWHGEWLTVKAIAGSGSDTAFKFDNGCESMSIGHSWQPYIVQVEEGGA